MYRIWSLLMQIKTDVQTSNSLSLQTHVSMHIYLHITKFNLIKVCMPRGWVQLQAETLKFSFIFIFILFLFCFVLCSFWAI